MTPRTAPRAAKPGMTAKKQRAFLLPLALTLLCTAAFFGFFIRPGLDHFGPTSLGTSFDFHSYFLPRFTLGSLEVFGGRLPTWNTYEYGGIPLLATAQPAALYPPKVLIFGIFPEGQAIWIFLVVHYVLLAFFFALFLRSDGLTHTSLFVGTALWLFSSPMLLGSYAPTRIANLVWMPLLFLVADRMGRGGGRRAFAWLALIAGVQLTAGYPEVTMDTGVLLALHATVSFLTGRWPLPPWKTVPLLALALILGALAAAAQLVPLAELALVSQRGRVASGVYHGPWDLVHTLLAAIPGLIPFALIGMFVPRARAATAGFVFCWLIGGGGLALLHRLPGFNLVRFPLTWAYLGFFYFAWLGAHGCDAVLRQGCGALAGPARATALVFIAAAGLFIAFVWGFHFHRFPSPEAPKTELVRYLAHPVAILLGVAGGLALVASASLTIRGTPNWHWTVALVLLTLAHLAAYPFGAAPSPLHRPFPVGQIARLHGLPRRISGRALSLEDLLYGYQITDRIPSPLGIEFSFLPHRDRELLDRLDFVPMLAQINWLRLTTAKGFLDAMDVEFVAAPVTETPLLLAHDLDLAGGSRGVSLFNNPDHMGHAWVNYAVKRVRSDEAALDYVLSSHFDPHQEVVLEEAPRGSFAERTTEPVTAPSAERRTSPTEVEFTVELDRPGVFVVSESAYPGWEATVDAKSTPWLHADYVLRAVELDAGRHRVHFEYRPASVRWGLRGSALGVAFIGVLLLSGRRTSRGVAQRAESTHRVT